MAKKMPKTLHLERFEVDTFETKVTVSESRRQQLFAEMYEKLRIDPERFMPEDLAGGTKYLATLPARK